MQKVQYRFRIRQYCFPLYDKNRYERALILRRINTQGFRDAASNLSFFYAGVSNYYELGGGF